MKYLAGLIITVLLISCQDVGDLTPVIIADDYVTENVIVVVVDGPRFSETWGDPEHKHIPALYNRLSGQGIFNQEFYNFGNTKTIPGHTAIITGVYETLDNNGLQFPTYPTFLQQWLYTTRKDPRKAWIVTSKQKLQVLANCSHLNWRNNYNPSVSAENRDDNETFTKLIEVMDEYSPNLVFVNLRGPDYYGHANDWENYLKSIRNTDSLFNELFDYINTDSNYAGTTTLFLTNDHGRHLDEIRSGFISHGDQCLGCTHINFFAYGPDFRENVILTRQREQVDIAPTIGRLLGFSIPHSQGEVMTELFK